MPTEMTVATALESCRCNLEKAAQAARKERQIGVFEYWRLMRATDPQVWNRKDRRTGMTVGQAIAEKIVEEGIVLGQFAEGSEVQGINWDGLLEFLKGLLAMAPEILAFIKAILAMFGFLL